MTLKREKLTTKVEKILNYNLLILLFLYLAYKASGTTTMNLNWPFEFERNLFRVIVVVTILSTLVKFRMSWIEKNRKLFFTLLTSSFITVLFYFIYRQNLEKFIVFLGIFMLAFAGFDNQKVIKAYLVSVGIMVAMAIFSSLGGFISNDIYYDDVFHNRSSLGIIYPTNLAAIIVYLLVGVWIVWGDKLTDPIVAMLALLSALFAYHVTYSATSTICSLLLCVLTLIHSLLCHHIIKAKGKRTIGVIAVLAYPLIGTLTFLLMAAYQHGYTLAGFPKAIVDRIGLAAQAWNQYGLTLFGSPLQQIGTSLYPTNVSYNFVDNSYAQMLLNYGIIFFVAISVLWEISAFRSWQKGDYRMTLGMALIALQSFLEHRFPQLNYNIFLIMAFTQFKAEPDEFRRINLKELRDKILQHIPAIALAVLAICCSPVLASWSRALAVYFGLTEGGLTQWKVCLGIFCCFAIFFGLMRSMDLLWNRLRSRKRMTWPLVFTVVISAAIVGGLIECNHLLDLITEDMKNRLEREEPAIELIKNNSSEPVYVDTWTEVYQRLFGGGFQYSLWNTEDLARYRRATVILDIDNDSNFFYDRGFLYTEISDDHAVYTTDTKVIAALEKNGYHLTGYYAAKHSADLESLAEENNLIYDTEGLHLNGSFASLTHGPDVNLRLGKYTITYVLRIDPEVYTIPEQEICRLRVDEYDGSVVLAEKPVFRSEFDETGQAQIEIVISDYLNSFHNVEFLAFTDDAVSMEITGLTWQMTPDYDVHRVYDKNWNVLQETYYDLEGNLAVLDQGYTIQTHRYDKRNHLIETCYFDAANQPVMITDGYARICWEKDRKDRITRESYYDVNGNPTALSSGQASDTRIYDKNNNVIDQVFYNTAGKRTIISSGYAEIRTTYDEQNKKIREQYFDTGALPCALPTGQYGVEYTYDADNRISGETYEDASGNSTLLTTGYASVRWEYDSSGRVIRESYYGLSGEALDCTSGYHTIDYKYDDTGNIVSTKYYNSRGQEVTIV